MPTSPPGSPPGGGGGQGGHHPAVGDVFASRSFSVTKHAWKGKYKRVLSLGPRGAATLHPGSMEAPNAWPYADIVSIMPLQVTFVILLS